MKYIIRSKTGDIFKLDNNTAAKLVNSGQYQYISKSEALNPPEYLKDNPEGMTRWYPVQSSNINEIQYIKSKQILRIKFGHPSVTGMYSYKNVPEIVFTAILNAPSKGHAFWELVRRYPDKYPYVREY